MFAIVSIILFNHKVMRRLWLLAGMTLVGTFLLDGAAFALANVSRSFTRGDSNVVVGSLVSAAKTPDTVELANTANADRLIGVVVPISQSLAANSTVTKAQVAMSGTADVLVSTLNGDIHAGDEVVVSPISGVGMKALAGARAIGIAQGDVTTTTSGSSTRTVDDGNGHSATVQISSIPLAIVIGYTAAAPTGNQGFLGGLQNFISTVAGHNVSVLQSVLAFLTTIIAIAALVGLVYGAIRGSIISLGRNPLARASIYQSLARIIIMALAIVVVSLVVIYLTLR